MCPVIIVPWLGWVLPAYETLYAIALAGAVLLGPFLIARLGAMPRTRVWVVVLILAVAALAGARAFFVATNWGRFAADPLAAAAIWRGGRHAAAAVATLLLAAPPLVRFAGLPAARFCDAGTPVVTAAYAVARLGCFLHGCCSGQLAGYSWCLTFPPHSAPYRLQLAERVIPVGAPHSVPVHPLQLYFAAWAVALTVLAIWWHQHKRFDGEVTLGISLLFAIGSAALESLRADYPGRQYVSGVPVLQWLALALAVATATVLFWQSQRARHAGGRPDRIVGAGS